jgi:hypothetical protein
VRAVKISIPKATPRPSRSPIASLIPAEAAVVAVRIEPAPSLRPSGRAAALRRTHIRTESVKTPKASNPRWPTNSSLRTT